MTNFQSEMQFAIALAHAAASRGEIPVGALIVDGQSREVIAEAYNEVEQNRHASAHAEMLAIERACKKLDSSRLDGCDLIVTLEPCAMCAMAISHARIRRVIFGAYDTKSGGIEHGARVFTHATTHHKPEVIGGVMEQECSGLMSDFFKSLR